jgi:hypothetical protein
MSSTDQAFYSTAAQVLPILLLAGWLELRVMHRLPIPEKMSGRFIWYFIAGTGIALVILGEVVSLVVLATGHAKHSDKAFVSDGLVIGGISVFVGLMATMDSQLDKGDPRRGLVRLLLVVVPVSVVATLLTR